MKRSMVWLLPLLLAACAGGPAVQLGSEQAVSQQTANSEERHRAKVHTELGSLYLQDGRVGVALEEAKIALFSDPTYAPAYNLQGLIHMYLRENDAAETNFRQALRLAGNDPEINNNFGWFLCQTGREKEAMSHFTVAIKNTLYATPAKPYTNAGLCYLRMKDDKAAEEHLLRSLRFDSANVQALYWLADISYRNGRLQEARFRLAELHKITEMNSESAWLGLRIERKLGDREAETRFATQLRRKFQGSPEHQKMMQGQFE